MGNSENKTTTIENLFKVHTHVPPSTRATVLTSTQPFSAVYTMELVQSFATSCHLDTGWCVYVYVSCYAQQ